MGLVWSKTRIKELYEEQLKKVLPTINYNISIRNLTNFPELITIGLDIVCGCYIVGS